jgi:GPI-anchor transamidase subunit S
MAPKEEDETDDDMVRNVAYKEQAKSEEPPRKTSSSARKEPPPEKPDAIWLRTKIILSFWAVILLFGLPVWWKTTSIYRARLPLQEMLDWSEGKVRSNGVCKGSVADSFVDI